MKLSLRALVLIGALLPATALCQPPALLRWWWDPRAMGIAFDSAGNIYVAKFANHLIDVHAPDGTQIAQWGSDGPYGWSVSGPGYLAIGGSDHLFIVEWTTHTVDQSGVQEFTTGGQFIAMIGTHSQGPSTLPGAFCSQSGIAVDADGRLYVTDDCSLRTQVFANDRTYLYDWSSSGNTIALDGMGHAFEVEWGGIIRKYDLSGVELAHWGGPGSGPGQFESPQGVAVDVDGRVYVSDTYNHRVQVFANDGTFLTQWGSFGYELGQFYRPMGVAVAADRTIYVADTWNGRVQVFAPLPKDVRVEVRPGSGDDVVNPGANGVLPVAILSEPHFDATTVDPRTVQLADASVRIRPNGEPMAWSRDVDGDGRADLLLHVETSELALAPGDTTAHLTGQAPNHLIVRGSARVHVVGSRRGLPKPQAQPVSISADAARCHVDAEVLPQGRVLARVQLAVDSPARLDLLDLTGRRLDTVRLGGATSNGLEYGLGPQGLAPGIYWVRLEQAGRVSTTRVAVIH